MQRPGTAGPMAALPAAHDPGEASRRRW